MTPIKVSNETTESSMLPNNQSPQTDKTPTNEISDRIKVILVFIADDNSCVKILFYKPKDSLVAFRVFSPTV